MEIRFASPLLGASGYATDGRSLLHTLGMLKYEVNASRLLPDTDEVDLEEPLASMIVESLQRSATESKVNIVNRSLSEYPVDLRGEINIRRITLETKRVPKLWVDQCNRHDQIWVPSNFNARGFISSGVAVDKVRVIPSPLLECDAAPALPRSPRTGSFHFLSIFRWQRRKGWDLLIRAFLEEFSPRESVELTLKIDPFILSNGALDISALWRLSNQLGFNGSYDLRRISVITGSLSPEAMRQLYANSDCFVLPSRGEGWGRPYMEAMASELPAIAPRWGGQLDFMDENNAFLVDYTEVKVSDIDVAEQPVYADQIWAEPNIDRLRFVMRTVFQDRDRAVQTGRTAAADVRKNFSPSQVALTLGAIVQNFK
jgi:glycosyltransferase involved in cell wall biosynthesis